jgi:nucleoside-diphosphate-sugar epimerase
VSVSHDPVAARPWLILGCGYVGEALARRLVEAGARVTVARRGAAAIAAIAARTGAIGAVLDLDDRAALAALTPGAVVVHLAPPPAGAVAAPGAHRVVYLSSTGVYAPGGGARVDEDWPLAPATATGAARLAVERAVLAGGAAVVLRAPGIYGPGRGVAARLRAGTYRIVGDGAAHVSRIHVDDLAAAIIAAGTARTLPRAVYNVADRDPCTAAEHGDGVAAALGLPPPPRVSADQVSSEVAGMLLADRRIDASRLEADLGWTPRFPSWRDALDPG